MWTEELLVNPLTCLLATRDQALLVFVEKDLLENSRVNIESLWLLPEPQKILNHQLPNGSWRFKGKRLGDELGEAYELLETWRTLRVLIEMYGFNNSHPMIHRACEFMLSYQTAEGDIRGILSNQYMPYYMGGILEILIKAGYEKDERIEKGMQWLLDKRQNDGGWIAPLLLYKMQDFRNICRLPPIQPPRQMPFSHMVTGMVIRAFAAHPRYRGSQSAVEAGMLLKSRFFKKDAYTSHQDESYWLKFQFPFWWTNLVTALDSLMRLDFPDKDEDIMKGIGWLIENQDQDGFWKASYGKKDVVDPDLWVSYSVCRILKYFLS